MEELRKKRKIRRKIYSTTVVFILFVLVILLSISTWRLFRKNLESRTYAREAAAELAALEAREAELSEDLEFLQSEEGKDREIRKKFNVAKEGEEVVLLVDRKNPTTTAEQNDEGKWKKFWKGVKSFFRFNL